MSDSTASDTDEQVRTVSFYFVSKSALILITKRFKEKE